MSEVDKKFMERCLHLASFGLGKTSPNPMVGSVIVNNGKIIGEGFHHCAGKAHAEVNAINSVKDKSLLKNSTLYVNLEPCVHYGKTPPCTDLIIKEGIAEVVISIKDPNPGVKGKGILKLKENGIKVKTGILKSESEELNKRFITSFNKKRPYIILKWAETLDGFIDKKRAIDREGYPSWITNKFGKVLVHKWRSEEDVFMVGTHTALMDNPRLTVREWKGRNPVRATIDYDNILPESLHVFDNESKSLIFKKPENCSYNKYFDCFPVKNRIDNIKDILEILNKHKYNSIVVEGGAEFLGSFINKSFWDEARIFTGDHYFKSGVKAPEIKGKVVSERKLGNSKLKILINEF